MAVLCSPFGPKPQFELSSGVPAVGNKLFFYVGGSVNTKQNTYTSSTGLVANTNPVVLDALGMPTTTEIWFTAGQTYKVVYAPSTDTDPPTSPIWTIDNLSGINDVSATFDEWKAGPTPTFVSATQFTLVGDQTNTFTVGRRIKATVTAGTVYGTITVSAFAVLTTVTVVIDSGNLDSGLSAISYGLLSAANSSIPSVKLVAGAWTLQNTLTMSGAAINEAARATVASAATTNLDTAAANYVQITGTTGITAITLSDGRERTVEFSGILTITNGASLILPTAANITTVAGDTAIIRGEAAGVVRVISYFRATGSPVLDGVYRSSQIFTVSGTYTAPAGLKRAKVTVVGGGGGGGGSGATSGGTGAAAGGGAGGGMAVKTVTAATIGASQTVTIGAGGLAGATGSTGGTGGTTSFGAIITATGGTGGAGSSAQSGPAPGGAGGQTPGTGSSGDYNLTGQGGGTSFVASSSGIGGIGGSSPMGGGGAAVSVSVSSAGTVGGNYGGGAGGSALGQSQSATVGSAGAPGVVIVEEFF